MPYMNRRDFLRAGLATGMFFSLSPIFGCGSSRSGDGRNPVSVDWFHLHLSHIVGNHPGTGGEYYLTTGGRKHHILPHDDQTLSVIPNSLWSQLDGQTPTHYIRSVNLPMETTSVMMLSYVGDDAHSILHIGMHVPDSTFHEQAKTAAEAVPYTCRQTNSSADSFAPEDNEGHVYSGLNSVQTAASLVFFHPELMTLDPNATSKIARHIWGLPEFYDLYCHIASTRYASMQGESVEMWATLEPAVDENNNPVLDSKNHQVQHINLTEITKEILGLVLRKALAKVKDDSLIPNKHYNPGEGVAEKVVDNPTGLAILSAASSSFKLSSQWSNGSWFYGMQWNDMKVLDPVKRQIQFSLTNASMRCYGLYLQWIDADDNPIDMRDRYGTGWLGYMPEGKGRSDEVDNSLFTLGLSSATQKFIDIYLSPATIMGVPIETLEQTYRPSMPANAVKLRVYVGSMGIPRATWEWGQPSTWLGAILTLVINVGISSYMLISGFGEDENVSLKKLILSDKGLWLSMATAAISTSVVLDDMVHNRSGDGSDYDMDGMKNAVKNLTANFATILIKILISKAMVKVAQWIASKEAELALEDAVPIAGLAFQAATLAATGAELAQTTAEIMASPMVYTHDFTIGRDLVVAINHDRRDFKFPSTATHYDVKAVVARGTTLTVTGRMPATTLSDPIIATIPGVPTGSTVRIAVNFYDKHENVVGTGFAGFYEVTPEKIANLTTVMTDADQEVSVPEWVKDQLRVVEGTTYYNTEHFLTALHSGLTPAQTDEVEVNYEFGILGAFSLIDVPNLITDAYDGVHYECTIKELPYPLNESSTYLHKEKIAYDSGRKWIDAAAPTDTVTSLSSIAGAAELHELGSMALVQRSGEFGFSWRSSSAGLAQCGSGATRAQLYTVQNMSLGQHIDLSLQKGLTGGIECGLAPPLGIVYDIHGPSSGRGHNYVLSPKDGYFYLRRYLANGKTPLALDGVQSYGCFEFPQQALAYHPGGYIVGVSRDYHKLLVLELPEQAFADSLAPRPAMFGGLGSLRGLLNHPVGVGVDNAGVIHVLEAGNRRLQAFNFNGTPVNAYGGKVSPFLTLPPSSEVASFLDLAVTGKGFLYLLGFRGYGNYPSDFSLFIYKPGGDFLTRVDGVAAGKIMVDVWRDLYTLNFEKTVLPDGTVEPSISHWIPDTPN